MRDSLKIAFGWVVGYFVVLWPICYALDGSLIRGLLNGIFGVIGTILILKFWDGYEK